MSSPRRPPTLRDIARACGVSHTLVSRALRNHPGVSPASRALVLRTAKRLGHRPDPLLSILLGRVRRGRAKRFQATLGWVNTHEREDWWRAVDYERGYLRGARARAESLGYRLDEFWLAEGGLGPGAFQRVLQTRAIYGLVLPAPRRLDWTETFDWSPFAVGVISWLGLDTCPWARVAIDFNHNLALALKRLEHLGHRRIGLCCTPGHDLISNHLLSGRYHSYQHGLPPARRVPLHLVAGGPDSTLDELRSWLREHRPDALIYSDSRILAALCRLGVRVPHDLAVAHLHLAEDVPDWAGVDPQTESLGAAAIDLVTAQLQRNETGRPALPPTLLLPGRWRDGWTAAPRSPV